MSPRLRLPVVVTGVLCLHALALWALNSGLLRRVVDQVLPVALLTSAVEAPVVPRVAPAPGKPEPRPAPPQAQAPSRVAPPSPAPASPAAAPAPSPAPLPATVAPADTGPAAPAAQSAVPQATAPQATTPARADPGPAVRMPAPPAPATAVAAAPPPKVELPTSDAAYLQNPRPPYPPLSKRLREEGSVVVRVFIGTDGLAQRAELRQSSGFDRLDRVAVDTALRWRYVPGKRGGVPEAMWVEVPREFRLESTRP